MKTRVRAIIADSLLTAILVSIAVCAIGFMSFSDFIRRVTFRVQVAVSWIRKPFG